MKRSVRLYLLVQHLGGGRGWRPEEVAEHFEREVARWIVAFAGAARAVEPPP